MLRRAATCPLLIGIRLPRQINVPPFLNPNQPNPFAFPFPIPTLDGRASAPYVSASPDPPLHVPHHQPTCHRLRSFCCPPPIGFFSKTPAIHICTSPPLSPSRHSAAMLDSVHMAKAHEILARFRPIAPKPSHPPPPSPDAPSPTDTAASSSLYRCVPRPCRSSKRGRGHLGAPSNKRQRTIFPLLPAAVPPPSYNHRAPAVPFPGVAPKKSADELLTLSLRPRSFNDDAPPLVEQDLLQKLQDQPKVIAPQPVRPVGSSISVTLISPHVEAETTPAPVARRREEVEAEVESDALPAVVSDWRNRVRLANSAYREMVGQPECPWIDAMVMAVDGGRGPATRRRPRRISGEVMLDVEESAMPKTAAGFSCRARIEWACNGRKNCVTAPCSVIRLFCESNDYLFAWRFDTCKATAEEENDDCTSPASVLVASIGMYN